MAFNWCRCR